MENDFKFDEAMGYLRTSRSTIYRMMWSGQLTGYKVGNTWRFTQEALDNCKVWTPAQPPQCVANDYETPDIMLDAQYQQI